jgi:hypothetical protein
MDSSEGAISIGGEDNRKRHLGLRRYPASKSSGTGSAFVAAIAAIELDPTCRSCERDVSSGSFGSARGCKIYSKESNRLARCLAGDGTVLAQAVAGHGRQVRRLRTARRCAAIRGADDVHARANLRGGGDDMREAVGQPRIILHAVESIARERTDLARDEIGHRRRRALIGDVRQVHAGHELEQLSRDMLRAADAGRGHV